MNSPRMLLLAISLGVTTMVAQADQPRDLNKLVPVQRAIVAARDALNANDAPKALQILEAQQTNGTGYLTYDNMLKEVRETLSKAEKPRQLPATLNPPIPPPPSVDDPIPMAKPMSPERFPDAPTEPAIRVPVMPVLPAESEPKAAVITPPKVEAAIVTPPRAEIDPFQQVPTHGKVAQTDLSRADAAFAAKRYPQAVALYQQALSQGLKLSADQRDQFVYSRLFVVAAKLKTGINDDGQRQALLTEVTDCRQVGSERLHDFADRLAKALQPTTAASTMAENNNPTIASGTGNFIVRGATDAAMTTDVLHVANAARQAMYQRWTGADPNTWNNPCEIVLHACGKDYHTTTKKPDTLNHHATVAVRGANIVTRRIDLCADDPHLLDLTLPNELTQLILMEMFAEQPLPKWALVGMGALSETPESVARYRRVVPQLLQERKLLTLNVLLDLQTFPEAEATTAFYAQSISLVSFLVEKKGCKALVTFLREAPRRGYAKALQTHYGFTDVNDLQQQWLKSLMQTK